MHKFIITVILAQGLFVPIAMSQVSGSTSDWTESVAIPYRPKLSEVTYHQLYNYKTRSSSGQFGNSSSEVKNDSQLKIRLGIPLLVRNATIFGVQLKYDHQNFTLDLENKPSTYELYNHIETRSFNSLGARFFFQKSLGNTREIRLIAGGEIKSDKLEIAANTMKYYAHFCYTKQLNERSKIGGGLIAGYSLGRMEVYPLFLYEHDINQKWTLDLQLPKQVALRFKANERFYITALTEVKGWRYAIHNNELSPDQTLILRKSDLNFGLSFEHEIHDWLWFGLDTGYSKNLRYFLAKPGDGRSDALIDVTLRDSPYLKMGLYIVPPEKLYR